MNTSFISINNLSKYFASSKWRRHQKTIALSGINIAINKGERTVLLGTNGAGKTTLLKILATAIIPDTGTAAIDSYILGRDDSVIKSFTGFVSNEDRSFYWRLTGYQNLEFFAALYGLKPSTTPQKINNLLESFHIDYAHKRFDSYSTGMKRKFALIRALMHDPSVLLLDEPTKSLDYLSSTEFRAIITAPSHKHRTIITATHDFDEAQFLGERFIFLHRGKILSQGTLDELRKQTGLERASINEIYLKLVNNA